ncbi:MAG: acyltransferase [Bacteroidales bacterium]|nr:acyltransferase [Bacteroidales bacterium]
MDRFAEYDDISRYRQTLMGIALFSVMFSHWFGFQEITTGIPYLVSTILTKLVFTGGLLFLSGFGLYYSFSKDHGVRGFYKRRLTRLYIPFLLLSLPLYTYFLCCRDDYGLLDYAGQLSTLFFWFKGNYGGMWYVAISLFLYLVFPAIYLFVFKTHSGGRVVAKACIMLITLYLALVGIRTFFPSYFEVVEIGIEKIPFFILGMLLAYGVRETVLTRKEYRYGVLVIGVLYAGLTALNRFMDSYWLNHFTGIFQKLFFIPLLCILFNLLGNGFVGRTVKSFFDWFGKYSLELYILHLHFYMFFHFGFLNTSLSDCAQATMAMCFALALCVPVNRLLAMVTKRR